MSSVLKLGLLILTAAASSMAQPSIGGIVNAASYSQAPQDSNNKPIGNNLIAQGTIFVIFGAKMGPASLVSAAAPFPTSLPDANGTSIAVSNGGQTLAAYVVYTSAGQVAAILPSNTPIGTGSVTVSFNGQTSTAYKISVVKSALGIFTQNSQGNGPAIANLYHGGNKPALAGLTNSAQGGDTIELYGTGLGAISGPDNVAPGAVSVGSNVTVNIAGKLGAVTYAGRSPGFAGLDQIDFQLPADVPTGCYIPAEVTASGIPTTTFYLSIGANSTTCVHPLGVPSDALARLDAGGTANIGHFLMLRAVVSGFPAEGAGGVFDTVTADGAFQLTNRILYSFGGANYAVASGACAVLDTLDPGTGFGVPNISLVGGKELQAGAGLNIAGSNGNSQGILKNDTGGYLAVFVGTLGAGTWTLSGTGGADVGIFSAKTTLPDNLVWSNSGNFASVPGGDITITWTGGNVNSSALVTISGSSVVINPTDPSKSRGRQFYCNAPASAGKFVVPLSVMKMPSSTVDAAAGEIAFGNLGINTGSGSAFTAPLTSGKLDAGYLAYGEAHTLQVKYQ